MSYQVDDFSRRLIKAEQELYHLKTTQVIGGENMSYFETVLPNKTYNFSGRQYWGLLLAFISESPFPLCSMELDIYENGVYVPNPYGVCSPYGVANNSICNYEFVCGEMLTPWLWTDDASYTVAGRKIYVRDPNNSLYLVMFSNRGTSPVEVSFRNIKFRTSHRGTCLAEFTDPYGD